MPDYFLSDHARYVIAERAIAEEWIAAALDHPDATTVDARDPAVSHALRAIEERDGRVLRVVYNGAQIPWVIIAAFFDRRERRRP